MRFVKVLAARGWFLVALATVGVVGCSNGSEEHARSYDPKALVPASGVVTLNGAPLAGAVIVFLGEVGLPGSGETDATGRYELKTARDTGVLPGDYKVSISYLVSTDGEVLGRDKRNVHGATKAIVTAKEQLPREYSDSISPKLTAHVPARGSSAINYDLKAEIAIPAKDITADAKLDKESPANDARSETKPENGSPAKTTSDGVPTKEEKKP